MGWGGQWHVSVLCCLGSQLGIQISQAWNHLKASPLSCLVLGWRMGTAAWSAYMCCLRVAWASSQYGCLRCSWLLTQHCMVITGTIPAKAKPLIVFYILSSFLNVFNWSVTTNDLSNVTKSGTPPKTNCFENTAFKKKRMYQSNFTFKLERRKTIISFHIFIISNSTCL